MAIGYSGILGVLWGRYRSISIHGMDWVASRPCLCDRSLWESGLARNFVSRAWVCFGSFFPLFFVSVGPTISCITLGFFSLDQSGGLVVSHPLEV